MGEGGGEVLSKTRCRRRYRLSGGRMDAYRGSSQAVLVRGEYDDWGRKDRGSDPQEAQGPLS